MPPTPPRASTARQPRRRLDPDDWTRAALGAIAENGIANVSVERLAKELGATKGSFYWHFADRAALIAAALVRWEHESTDRIIEQLGELDDPRLELRRLLETAFEARPGVLIEANLLADADDPAVHEVLERVARKRLAFVDTIFARIGTAGGSDRALLAFSAYLGLAQLRRTAPSLTPSADRNAAYIDHVIACLLDEPVGRER